MRVLIALICSAALALASCGGKSQKELPILGFRKIENGDTILHSIRGFRFMNQDSVWISNSDLEGRIYVADFFFTSCPTICPQMTLQMTRIAEAFEDNPNVALLSHTIDVKRDTPPVLKSYAEKTNAPLANWHFLTGDKDSIFSIAHDYLSVALEDNEAPGGFDHSGKLILVDGKGHVRSFCNGTDSKDVDRLMEDIRTLLNESS